MEYILNYKFLINYGDLFFFFYGFKKNLIVFYLLEG